jgi:hypothetical protein
LPAQAFSQAWNCSAMPRSVFRLTGYSCRYVLSVLAALAESSSREAA